MPLSYQGFLFPHHALSMRVSVIFSLYQVFSIFSFPSPRFVDAGVPFPNRDFLFPHLALSLRVSVIFSPFSSPRFVDAGVPFPNRDFLFPHLTLSLWVIVIFSLYQVFSIFSISSGSTSSDAVPSISRHLCDFDYMSWANSFYADGGIPPQQGQFLYRQLSSAMVVDIPVVLTGGPIIMPASSAIHHNYTISYIFPSFLPPCSTLLPS